MKPNWIALVYHKHPPQSKRFQTGGNIAVQKGFERMFHRRDPRIPALTTLARISSADLETSSVVQVSQNKTSILQEVPVEIWTDHLANRICFVVNAHINGSVSESRFSKTKKGPSYFALR